MGGRHITVNDEHCRAYCIIIQCQTWQQLKERNPYPGIFPIHSLRLLFCYINIHLPSLSCVTGQGPEANLKNHTFIMSSQGPTLFEHAKEKHYGPPNTPCRSRDRSDIPAHMHNANAGTRQNPGSANCARRQRSNRRHNRTNPDCSVFHSARQVVVTNASFTNHQTVHVHNKPCEPLGEKPTEASQLPLKSDTGNTPTNQPDSAESSRTRSQSASPTRLSMPKSNAEIYQEHIDKTRSRGIALHVPQPNSELPREYRVKGVSIGDVVIITPEGAFDVLFNILLPSSDPANPAQLPPDFTPLSPPLQRMDIQKFKEFSRGSHIVSPNVSPVKGGTFNDSGTKFQSSVADGAILVMPDGASAEELSNLAIFHKYIKENAHSFYDYARNVRGRAIKNGQLHVVHGCRKATSWGIATFTDTSDFQLEFLPTRGSGGHEELSWNYTMKRGTTNVKVGPDAEDNEDLNGIEDGVRPKNQCLFASTLSIRLGGRSRNKRQRKSSVTQKVEESDNSGSSCQLSSTGNSQTSGSGTGSSNAPSNKRSCDSPREGNIPTEPTSHDADELHDELEDDFDDYDNEVTIKQNSPSEYPTCPSEILTRHLLKVAPNASVAVASNRDLAGCVLSNDPDQLINSVCEANTICEKDGLVFFEPKEFHPPHEDIERILQSINDGKFHVENYLFGPFGKRILDKMSSSSEILSSLNQPMAWNSHEYPSRPLSLDHIMSFCLQSIEERVSLTLARRPTVAELRRKLQKEQNMARDSVNAQTIKSLAESLLLRFIGFSQQNDLDEAIWLFEHAVTATSQQTYQYLEVLRSLSICLAARYHLTKQSHDHQRFMECNSLQRRLDIEKLLAPIKNALLSLRPLTTSSNIWDLFSVSRQTSLDNTNMPFLSSTAISQQIPRLYGDPPGQLLQRPSIIQPQLHVQKSLANPEELEKPCNRAMMPLQQRVATEEAEGQRQRGPFVKLPTSSFQYLRGRRTRLLNPDTEIFHPCRRSYSLGKTRGSCMVQPTTHTLVVTDSPTLAAGPYPSEHRPYTRCITPERSDFSPALRNDWSQNSVDHASGLSSHNSVSSFNIDEGDKSRLRSSSVPVRSVRRPHAELEIWTNVAPPVVLVTPIQVGSSDGPAAARVFNTYGMASTGSSGYRPKGPRRDMEMKESDNKEEGIIMPSSVAQEKLKALAQRRGIPLARRASEGNIQEVPAAPSQSQPLAPVVDDDVVPQWANVSSQPLPIRAQSQASLSRRVPGGLQITRAEPIPVEDPYNLLLSVAPTMPKTTRRNMLANEMSESLRHNLHRQRHLNKPNSASLKRSASVGGSRNSRHAPLPPDDDLPPTVQLHAKKTEREGTSLMVDTPVLTEEEFDVARQRRETLSRNKSCASAHDDFHTTGK